MRVALFVSCVNDALYPRTGRAVVRLLERLGHEVVFEPAQTCCGQAHWAAGYHREAKALAERFAGLFGRYETVVTPSASARTSKPAKMGTLGRSGRLRAAHCTASAKTSRSSRIFTLPPTCPRPRARVMIPMRPDPSGYFDPFSPGNNSRSSSAAAITSS